MFQWHKSCSYDEEQKKRFHLAARARLRKLAAELRLPSGTYDIRSNKGGIAVSGEITLHHDRIYVQVCQSVMGSRSSILIRTCKGRRDYTGGPNHFVALSLLDDIPALAASVHAVTGVDAAETDPVNHPMNASRLARYRRRMQRTGDYAWRSEAMSLVHAREVFPLYRPLLPRDTPVEFDAWCTASGLVETIDAALQAISRWEHARMADRIPH